MFVSSSLSSAINQNLVNDLCFCNCRSQKLIETIAMDFTASLVKEREYLPWYMGTKHLQYTEVMLQNDPVSGSMIQYMRTLVNQIYDQLSVGNWRDLDPFLNHTQL